MAGAVKNSVVLLKNLTEQAKPQLRIIMAYAKVELTPPSPGEWAAVKTGFQNLVKAAKSGSYRNLTVREAWLNTLVGIEVLCWFYIGECIGKRGLIGYQV